MVSICRLILWCASLDLLDANAFDRLLALNGADSNGQLLSTPLFFICSA